VGLVHLLSTHRPSCPSHQRATLPGRGRLKLGGPWCRIARAHGISGLNGPAFMRRRYEELVREP
jgi:hypothetical protein